MLTKTLMNVKRLKQYSVFLILLAVNGHVSADELVNNHIEASRKVANDFMQGLSKILKEQLALSGVNGVINVCKQVAPAMAKAASSSQVVVTRVSLKYRNPSMGVPDHWEAEKLANFDRLQLEGKPANEMEVAEVTTVSGQRWMRYMKAIPTQAMCLQCHGKTDDIKPSAKALLQQLYPNDQAIGYAVGQVRGAISIKTMLD